MRDNKLIQFYLTDYCNSRCKTCDIWKVALRDICTHIDYRKVIEIIEQYPDADYVFGGGEFTWYEHRDKLLEYCKEHNVKYTILSNAIDVSELMRLVDEYDVQNVTISCDGARHNWIRGVVGNLDNIDFFVRHYKDKIPNLKISYTYSKYNEDCVDEDMEMFRNWGFDKVYLCIASQMDLLDNSKHLEFVPSSLDGLRNNMKMFYDKDREYLDRIFNKWHKKKCDSTYTVFTIYTNGDVVRCQSYLSKEVLGNINIDKFSDIVREVENIKHIFTCRFDRKCGLLCQRRYD